MPNLYRWVRNQIPNDNSWYLVVEIFWATIYASAQSFCAAYAIRLGASNPQVSLLSSIPALTAALVMLPAGRFLQSRVRYKNWLLGALFLARAGTLLFILIPWLHLGSISQGTLFIIVFVALTFPGHFFNLGFNTFLSHAVDVRHRADTFATRNAVSGAMLAVFSVALGQWLTRVSFPGNYQLMFLFAFVFSMLSLYYLSKVRLADGPRDTAPRAVNAARQTPRGQWSVLVQALRRERGFTQITINTFLHGVGLWTAGPLYVLYFVRTLGASEAWLGLFGSLGALTSIFGYIFWRRVLKRWGEPKTLRRTIVLLGLYPALMGAIPSLPAILFFAGLNGLVSPAVNLSHFNTFLAVMPEDKRHDYTARYMTLMNIGAFVCPLIGVALADRFGFGPVIIVCGLLSTVGSTGPSSSGRSGATLAGPEVVPGAAAQPAGPPNKLRSRVGRFSERSLKIIGRRCDDFRENLWRGPSRPGVYSYG